MNKEKKEIEERFNKKFDAKWPSVRSYTGGSMQRWLTNFWLKELDSYANKKLEEVMYEIADRFKHKFNGFGGKLGFTLSEILEILSNK